MLKISAHLSESRWTYLNLCQYLYTIFEDHRIVYILAIFMPSQIFLIYTNLYTCVIQHEAVILVQPAILCTPVCVSIPW